LTGAFSQGFNRTCGKDLVAVSCVSCVIRKLFEGEEEEEDGRERQGKEDCPFLFFPPLLLLGKVVRILGQKARLICGSLCRNLDSLFFY